MSVAFGVALTLAGVMMMLAPIFDRAPRIVDLMLGAAASLRAAIPVTRDDGRFSAELDRLEDAP